MGTPRRSVARPRLLGSPSAGQRGAGVGVRAPYFREGLQLEMLKRNVGKLGRSLSVGVSEDRKQVPKTTGRCPPVCQQWGCPCVRRVLEVGMEVGAVCQVEAGNGSEVPGPGVPVAALLSWGTAMHYPLRKTVRCQRMGGRRRLFCVTNCS